MAASSSRPSASTGGEVDLTHDASVEAAGLHGGDAEFTRLYDEFSLRVAGLVRRLILDEDLVDDIVQETFLRAYNGGLHLEYRGSNRERDQWPWLAAVARNLALDALRRRKHPVEDELSEEVAEQAAVLDDPEVQLLAARRREGIAQALTEMCPRQRRMLVLKHVKGWTYHDIAAVEGLSLEALKSVLARACRAFRSTYGSIAERSGLGVVAGLVITRVLAKLRVHVLGAPEATAAAAAGSPALMNTLATLAMLGAVGAAGVLGGSAAGASPDAEPEPMPEVAVQAEPVAVETVAVSHLAAASSDGVTVDSEAVVAVETSSAPSGEPTGTDALVDTDDVVPVDAPPVRAGAAGGVTREDDGFGTEHASSIDLDGDGSRNAGASGRAGVDGRPPEERGVATAVAWPVFEESSTALAA